MPGRLKGKAALVTGGAQGLGKAICEAFASEGASVALMDIQPEGEKVVACLCTQHGNKHCMIVGDVTTTEEVIQCFRTAQEKLGQKCTILVNNAGICINKPFVQMEDAAFDKVIDVNLKGTFLMSREFIKFLLEDKDRQPASIINMASLAGKVGAPGMQAYGASKGGIITLSKCIALEHAKDNIRCNAVMPGTIMTDILSSVTPEYLKMVTSKIPMGRIGEPSDVANACLYLASEESRYVTGATLEITGGLGA